MGPPTDPGPSGSARVSKWSVCPWLNVMNLVLISFIWDTYLAKSDLSVLVMKEHFSVLAMSILIYFF
ncbi:unnamed protein product, partial [Staurois parvus]